MKQRAVFARYALAGGIAVLFASCGVPAAAGEFSAEQVRFFEKKVRPLLAEHCYECHGPEAEKPKAGLRLDSRASVLAGGDSGAAVVPGKPGESLLMRAVRYRSPEMPPSGKLSDEEIAVLELWVKMKVPWPEPKAEKALRTEGETSYDWRKLRKSHWAWQPVEKPQPPAVEAANWPRNALDRFVLARLEEAGLEPAPPADRRTLLRRAYFDLIGLPPTPEEVEAFVNDERPGAFARVVDRLLDSPHYGERWGRHWLDVARYSDGFGGFLDRAALPAAWRYRDWVIRAFNRDLPYDEFVKRQIAGDLLPAEKGFYGPGFLALGPTYRSDGGDPASVAKAKAETLDDRVDTLTRGFLGLTVSCARCHDHKFDPVPQKDYYALAGVFHNTKKVDKPLVPQKVVRRYNEAQQAINKLQKKIKQRRSKAKQSDGKIAPDEKQQLEKLKAELKTLQENAPPKYPVTHTLTDTGSQDMHVALRGNLRKPGEPAPRGFLHILSGGDPRRFTKGSGRRGLAAAVADPDNPLTARVMVNRVWGWHFGKAIVRTPSNFGELGREPTHPRLLDWLAARFMENGWSLKELHRTIMLSATYRMGAAYDEKAFAADGSNKLLWRMNPRRLDVESLRDAMLAVTGELDEAVGGPPTADVRGSRRRTLYFKISRNGDRFASDTFLRRFDFPSARASVAKRTTSTVPQQYLFLMNSTFMADRAKALAARLAREADGNEQRIDRAYRLLYGRPPTDKEKRLGLAFLSADTDEGAKLSRWEEYAQVLLSANQFLYVR